MSCDFAFLTFLLAPFGGEGIYKKISTSLYNFLLEDQQSY